MHIKKANQNDAGIIMDLLNESSKLLHSKNIGQWKEKFNRIDIENEIRLDRVHKIVRFWKIISVFSIKDSGYFWPTSENKFESIYFYGFCLSKSLIGGGSGSKIYEKIEKFMMENPKMNRIRLDCWAGNNFLKKFYEKNQFIHNGDFPENDYRISLYEKIIKRTRITTTRINEKVNSLGNKK